MTNHSAQRAEGLGASGAASFWLLLGVATSFISLLAVANSVGALVVFGPWAAVSYVLGARLLRRRPERRVLVVSAGLAAVSLGLSILGLAGAAPGLSIGIPIVLAVLSGAAVAYSVLALVARPVTDEPQSSSDAWFDVTIWAQRAALVLLFGGLAIIVGSFADWGACSQEPCEGSGPALFHIWERTGVSFGPGIVTAALGLLTVILGVDATRGRDRAVPPEVPLIVATAVLVMVGAYVVRVHIVPLYRVYGPLEGVILVVGGAAAAVLASLRLRRTWRSGSRRDATEPTRRDRCVDRLSQP